MTIAIIDYGSGNLLSVSRALQHCGADCRITGNADAIASATALVLPGVGAFHDGMMGLASRGLIEPIIAHARAGRALLGICLGMQMLATTGEEFGEHAGLGLIPGKVRAIPNIDSDGTRRKTPFIGWAPLECPAATGWESSVLEDCKSEDSVYLVHSFHLLPDDQADLLATYRFHEDEVTAAVRRGNVTGLQFHPEKSGRVGLGILKTFVSQVQRQPG